MTKNIAQKKWREKIKNKRIQAGGKIESHLTKEEEYFILALVRTHEHTKKSKKF